ncbi:uncharacterized protein PRCAT00002867001 [Priceomyces carsonii]|uniref:uncharacterized protein n=1 Tax=Priceomyces carsonii TaxID=28549 RepID=UPI002EDA578B|nr:unnamed protein product [Priceomyces carsonii]
MDDTVKSLIRFVARGFYSKPYILILDALLVHSVLSEDDLIYLLSIHRKELRSLCNKLVDDRLIVNHIQKEENSQQRLITRTYFYIHIVEAVDAIKWKVHSVVNIIKQEMTQFGNPQGYVCPRCGKKVSQLDAISLLSDDKANFICDNCGGVLIEDDSSQQASLRQEKLERLMIQVDPIISYLKKIDDAYIEDNSFESSLTKSIPAQSSSAASYAVSNNVSSRSRSNLSSSLQNAASKSQATLHVSITANDENYEKEQLEKERRRQKLEQNALPSWHSSSTVGESGLGKLDDEKDLSLQGDEDMKVKVESENHNGDINMKLENTSMNVTPAPAEEEEPSLAAPSTASELKDKEAQDALAAYYSQLAEREAEDLDEEIDDEDFDDFEDI